MRAHHRAWLDAHPERSLEWFQDRMNDCFEVHHIDCDHLNNDPKNLILIDGIDHFALHGAKRKITLDIEHRRRAGKLGSDARNRKLSPGRRSRISRKAARARWKKVKAAVAKP